MKASELRDKIKVLVKKVYSEKSVSNDAAVAYDELTKFPLLKDVIVDLLTHEFDSFLEDIEWVSPRPTVFRILLLNGESFLLMYTEKSWIATVEGKKYYLLNLDEEERAAQAISRILSYGSMESSDEESEDGGEDDVDADVDIDDEL